MKIYKKKEQKTWSLDLRKKDGGIFLVAVDDCTGNIAANFIEIGGGGVSLCAAAKEALIVGGYDPHDNGMEYGKFDEVKML